MGIFDNIKNPFGKKDEAETKDDAKPQPRPRISEPPKVDPVVDWIVQKRESGTSDDEIKQLLLAHKHSPQDIEKAMAAANALGGPEPMDLPDLPDPSTFRPNPKSNPDVETYDRSQSMAEIENLIDDRVKKIRGDVDKLIQWKDDTTAHLDKLQTQLDQLVEMMTQQRDAERTKFSEYDEHLKEVKIELKASQEVFKKGLPEFTKAVQELTRMSKRKPSSGSGASSGSGRSRLEDTV